MKQFVPGWLVALGLVVALAAIGVATIIRGRVAGPFESSGAWLAGLISAGVVAVVLSVGVADVHVALLVNWLDSVFPPYRGMRDAQKWDAVVAFLYSQLIPFGAMYLSTLLRQNVGNVSRRDVAIGLVTALTIALPLYYGNGLLYGMHQQIQTSEYPAGWFAADRLLANDPNPGRTVILPWHGYLPLSFVANR